MPTSTHLLVTDQQQTVFRRGSDRQLFSPFGFGARQALGFNGERLDGLTERYLLGHGYRAFSTVLMRFVSPDSWSPFGEGGLNAYAYCLGDPVNARDPSGHLRIRVPRSKRLRSNGRELQTLFAGPRLPRITRRRPGLAAGSRRAADSAPIPESASQIADVSGFNLTVVRTGDGRRFNSIAIDRRRGPAWSQLPPELGRAPRRLNAVEAGRYAAIISPENLYTVARNRAPAPPAALHRPVSPQPNAALVREASPHGPAASPPGPAANSANRRNSDVRGE